MIRTIAVLSVLASAVVAQSSTGSSSTPAPTGNPFIPQGISGGCSSFLTALNADADLAACVQPIADATAQFGPSGNTSAASLDEVTAALNSLCSPATSSCSDSTLRTTLADFTKACPAELVGPSANAAVVRQYDVLYVLTPFKAAVCSKDDTGAYSATQISAGSGPAGSKLVEQKKEFDVSSLYSNLEESAALQRRQRVIVQNNSLALVPNTTTFRDSGVAFLFLTPDTDAAQLCTSVTRAVLTPYFAWEQSVPHAAGLPQSPLLGGQPALVKAVNDICGPSFLSGAVQAAGGLANGNPFSASAGVRVAVDDIATMGTLLAAVAAGFAALL